MNLLEQIRRIERIDQLIRMKATGTPRQLASRLNMSERSIHRLIEMMKNMHAPIYYSLIRQSYCYEENVHFKFGFYFEEKNLKKVKGGMQKNNDDFDFFYRTAKFWQSNGLCL